jgi:hypothetical protein
MVDRSRTVWKLKRGIYEAVEFGEVEATTADTVTITSLSGTAHVIYRAVFWKMDDGMVVASTYVEPTPNMNRCTIGQDTTPANVTNCKLIYMVYGVKA